VETKDCNSFVDLLAESGEYITVVQGVSMFPMLRLGKDPVHIVPVVHPLKPYDVAVYWRGDNFVVHRVLEVHSDHYVIRGDNCIGKEYVPCASVVGVVDGFWRSGRYVSAGNFLYRLYSRIWVAANPLVRLAHAVRL